jgi:small subunit ribosomal protein S16
MTTHERYTKSLQKPMGRKWNFLLAAAPLGFAFAGADEGVRRYTSLPFGLSSCIIIVCLDVAGLFRNKDIRLVLMIRLSRMGARKQPHYRIVVIEKARARNGRPVEVVGTYNPRTNPASVEMKRDRVDYWVSKGAQMSDRVNKLYAKAPAAAPAPAA